MGIGYWVLDEGVVTLGGCAGPGGTEYNSVPSVEYNFVPSVEYNSVPSVEYNFVLSVVQLRAISSRDER